ncbi:MAG: hypothetical protein O2820_09915 [Planctomycetota bacterium]|nr:hypothetical protein [Planctomycetota bacterium]MDA1249528.1 hypothetical protein [Planctomycetota bacterium]
MGVFLRGSAGSLENVGRLALSALLLILFPCGARSQFEESEKKIDSPGLVIEAAIGWDGIVDPARPVPISFLLTNHSDRMIEGRLTLSEPVNGHEVDLGEVFVAPGTSRRVASIQAMEKWYECFATLTGEEDVLWRRELPINTGRQFLEDVNFALFVDDGGRRLQLPGALSDSSLVGAADAMSGATGRSIQCLTAKSWQVPNHPGPLVAMQAIIFREGAVESALNRAQWRSVAEWVCQGGTLFIHAKSEEIIDRLKESSPLPGSAGVQSEEFKIRHVGLGAIYEYSQPLVSDEGASTRKLIAEAVALLPKHHVTSLVEQGDVRSTRDGGTERNRILIVAFFGLYTLLSGVVAILLFRMSQQKSAIYMCIVVAGACVCSGLLGGLLRFSQGDADWLTVTQGGVGGAVQVARIEVLSAGGRNTKVAVSGENVDLQFTPQARRSYSWNSPSKGFPAFTWRLHVA